MLVAKEYPSKVIIPAPNLDQEPTALALAVVETFKALSQFIEQEKFTEATALLQTHDIVAALQRVLGKVEFSHYGQYIPQSESAHAAFNAWRSFISKFHLKYHFWLAATLDNTKKAEFIADCHNRSELAQLSASDQVKTFYRLSDTELEKLRQESSSDNFFTSEFWQKFEAIKSDPTLLQQYATLFETTRLNFARFCLAASELFPYHDYRLMTKIASSLKTAITCNHSASHPYINAILQLPTGDVSHHAWAFTKDYQRSWTMLDTRHNITFSTALLLLEQHAQEAISQGQELELVALIKQLFGDVNLLSQQIAEKRLTGSMLKSWIDFNTLSVMLHQGAYPALMQKMQLNPPSIDVLQFQRELAQDDELSAKISQLSELQCSIEYHQRTLSKKEKLHAAEKYTSEISRNEVQYFKAEIERDIEVLATTKARLDASANYPKHHAIKAYQEFYDCFEKKLKSHLQPDTFAPHNQKLELQYINEFAQMLPMCWHLLPEDRDQIAAFEPCRIRMATILLDAIVRNTNATIEAATKTTRMTLLQTLLAPNAPLASVVNFIASTDRHCPLFTYLDRVENGIEIAGIFLNAGMDINTHEHILSTDERVRNLEVHQLTLLDRVLWTEAGVTPDYTFGIFLLERGAKFNPRAIREGAKQYPFKTLQHYCQMAVPDYRNIELLLKAGVNPDSRYYDEQLEQELTLVARTCLSAKPNEALIDLLIRFGANIHIAVIALFEEEEPDLEKAMWLLAKQPSAREQILTTCLTQECERETPREAVLKLLRAESITVRSEALNRMMRTALYTLDIAAVKLFIALGADVNSVGSSQEWAQSPFHFLCLRPALQRPEELFNLFATEVNKNRRVRGIYNNLTPLEYYLTHCEKPEIEMVQRLMTTQNVKSQKVVPVGLHSSTSIHHQSVLLIYIKRRNVDQEIVQLILDAGASLEGVKEELEKDRYSYDPTARNLLQQIAAHEAKQTSPSSVANSMETFNPN